MKPGFLEKLIGSLGRIGPVPEGLVTWLIAAAALVGCCLVIGKRFQQ